MRRPALLLTSLVFLVLATACDDSLVEPSLQSPTIPSAYAAPLATVSRLDLGTLGGTRSYATDVNDLGTVVGWSENAAGAGRAFAWTLARGMIDLGTLPGDDWSRAISITNTGEVFGVSGRLGDNTGVPVVWTPSGDATSLPIPSLPDGKHVFFSNRNVLGHVVGTDLGCCSYFTKAWVWSKSAGIHDIDLDIPGRSGESYGTDINTWGLAVGTFRARVCTGETHSGECWHVFLWNSFTGKARDIGIPSGDNLGRVQVTAAAINDLGAVVGWMRFHGASLGRLEPYLWTDSRGFTMLPISPNGESSAADLNLVGTVVGGDGGGPAAWPREGGIVRLDPNPGTAMGVNLFGIVVGTSFDGTGSHATLWKLGRGRGADPQQSTTSASSAGVNSARTASDAPSGQIACLSDHNALMSKQRLIECFVRTRE